MLSNNNNISMAYSGGVMTWERLFTNGLGTKVLAGVLIITTSSAVGVAYNALQTLIRIETNQIHMQQRFERLDHRLQRLEDDRRSR